ncbi:glycoprotein-N-acetylgalactosamine 3-beta-galactosyltransferase 1-like [Procambarus clarkii]|uniref:glycoprotein-N-acetylgalactosamine 3-beta-galactosyltransferase 1-like n=1 Tax=Procambarus clarkii TaxID=6728 RepID=UPI0037427B85
MSRQPLSHDDLVDEVVPAFPLKTHNHSHHPVKALQETQKVRVLCWVMTRPETHHSKAVHVKATWGARCDKLIFMSSKNDTQLGTIDLGVGEGRNVLWGKTKAAFTYVYKNYLSQYDWFFKADDDTYTIMENMRYMLSTYDPNFPIYFGSKFKKFSKQGYMSGGGGYVLSREALKQFVEVALPDKKLCKHDDTGSEDAEMGKCLNNIGVVAGDSRDSMGRGRFFPFTPSTHLFGGVPNWYFEYVYYPPDTGLNCCSDSAVTFHYVNTQLMYVMEYLLYHLRPHGLHPNHPVPAPLPPDLDSIHPQMLMNRGVTTLAAGRKQEITGKNKEESGSKQEISRLQAVTKQEVIWRDQNVAEMEQQEKKSTYKDEEAVKIKMKV